jgi:hypothetical protein
MVSRGSSSEAPTQTVQSTTVADFPAGGDFNCLDDDGNSWHFKANGDVITYDWNVPTENPSNPSIGCKRFRDAENVIEVIEHIAKIGYTFRKANFKFPSADHLCYADLVEEEEGGGVTETPAPHTVRN